MDQDPYAQLRSFIDRFLQITEAEWQAHRDSLTIRKLRKGDFLVAEGQICEHVWFINRGCFRVFTRVNGQELTNYFFFENSYVTDYESFLTRKPSPDTIVAMEDAELLQISYPNVQMLYEKFPVWQKYGRLMAEDVYILAVNRARDLQFNSPEALYLKIMKEQPQIIERIPQQYIAAYLTIQPESLSRIRKRLMTEEKRV